MSIRVQVRSEVHMILAKKELKGVTRNFVRFVELTQALLLVSVLLIVDLYGPVRAFPVPGWAWVLSVIIWGCTFLVVVARMTVPSFRKQAVILRPRVQALWFSRFPGPWLFMTAFGVSIPIGLYVAFPLASSINGDIGVAVHYLGLFGLVAAVSLVSLRFNESSLKAESAKSTRASWHSQVRFLGIMCFGIGLGLFLGGLLMPESRWSFWVPAGIYLVASVLGVGVDLLAQRRGNKAEPVGKKSG